VSIESLRKANQENQRRVTVNAGLLIAAMREIRAHAKVNGEGVMTSVIIKSIEEALKK